MSVPFPIASVRLGEMTKEIPTASAGNQYTGKMVRDSTVPDQKSKEETIQDLGFSKKQVQRFETLADNRDLVEQEKAQAREEVIKNQPAKWSAISFLLSISCGGEILLYCILL